MQSERNSATSGTDSPVTPPGPLVRALLNVESAARELDALFDFHNKGELCGEWELDGRRASQVASMALLSLHDYLNDVRAAREGYGVAGATRIDVDIEVLVAYGHEDTARDRHGDAAVDEWFRNIGENPEAAREETSS